MIAMGARRASECNYDLLWNCGEVHVFICMQIFVFIFPVIFLASISLRNATAIITISVVIPQCEVSGKGAKYVEVMCKLSTGKKKDNVKTNQCKQV